MIIYSSFEYGAQIIHNCVQSFLDSLPRDRETVVMKAHKHFHHPHITATEPLAQPIAHATVISNQLQFDDRKVRLLPIYCSTDCPAVICCWRQSVCRVNCYCLSQNSHIWFRAPRNKDHSFLSHATEYYCAGRSDKILLALVSTVLVSWMYICSFIFLLVLKLDLLSDKRRFPPTDAVSDMSLPVDTDQLVNITCSRFRSSVCASLPL